jgi:histidinol-phosphate phosphatase family protein
MQAADQERPRAVDAGTAAAGFTAVVLVGGAGTRLATVLDDCPKPLAPVDGEPFLLRLLDWLVAGGAVRIVLCTGHRGDRVTAAVGSEHAGVPVVYSHEPAPLGTGGALRLAAPLLAGETHVLVANGDSYVDFDLAAFVAFARGATTAAALLAVPVDDTSRYGALELGPRGRVLALHEKRAGGGAGPISAGVLWLPVAALVALPAGPSSLERDLLPTLVADGLAAMVAAAPFLDIGTPATLAAAPAFFAACAQRRARPRHGLLLLDRDGTLIEERHYLADPAGVTLLPGVVDGLRELVERGYELAVVTNQSGIGRGRFGETELAAVHAELQRQLAAAGLAVRGIWHCPHAPADACTCRKPEPGLLTAALAQLGYAPSQCVVVGDKVCDIELGRRSGVRTVLVRTGYGIGTERDGLCAPDLVVDDLRALAGQELAR